MRGTEGAPCTFAGASSKGEGVGPASGRGFEPGARGALGGRGRESEAPASAPVSGEATTVPAPPPDEPMGDIAGDVVTSAPTLDIMLGRLPRHETEAEASARRVIAFGSLPALVGESLEACVARHRAGTRSMATP